MWKRSMILAFLFALAGLPEWVMAAGSSNVNMIGFSKNGRYVAYEITFYDDMAGSGYKKVRFVDVPANRFVQTVTVWDQNDRPGNDENKIQKQIDHYLLKYRIVLGNTGERLFQDETFANPTHYQLPNALTKVVRNVSIRNFKRKASNNTYQIILKEIKSNSTHCKSRLQNSRKTKIFELSMIQQDSLKILQKDTKLFKSRQCPFAYGIHQIIQYDDKICVFLDSWTPGSEGPNVRKLIVTGNLP